MTTAHEKIEAMKAAEQPTTNKEDKEAKKKENYKLGVEVALSVLKSKPYLFWDQTCDRWFEYVDDEWRDYVYQTMLREYGYALGRSEEALAGFQQTMYDPAHNRRRKGQTNDFDVERCAQERPSLINRAVTDKWLQPNRKADGSVEAAELHPAFDALLRCLSSGRQAEREHIESCLYWKHKNPAEFKMPALCLYGGSGNGKGIFHEHVLKRIFTMKHWGMVQGENNTLRFQDRLADKIVFLFDEANFRSAEHADYLKAMLQKEDFSIEPKGLRPYTAKMQIWFHLYSNHKLNSPVLATGTDVDRRFSFIRTKQALWEMLATENPSFGPVLDEKGEPNNVTENNVKNWLNADGGWMQAAFTNEEELKRFLSYLYIKYADMKNCPLAFHGEDYRLLLVNSQTPEEAVCEDVFVTDANFLSISDMSLYALYQHRARMEGVKPNFVLSNKNFKNSVLEYIERKRLPIINDKVQRYDKAGKRSAAMCFVLTKEARGNRKLMINTEEYMPEVFKPISAEDAAYNNRVNKNSVALFKQNIGQLQLDDSPVSSIAAALNKSAST